MNKKQLIFHLKAALAILEEPAPANLLEAAIRSQLKPGTKWIAATEIYAVIEKYLQEPLEPTDPLKIGKLLAKYKFKRHVKKVNNITTIGYYVKSIN